MKLKASALAGVLTVTTVAGILVFNTDAAKKVMDNIEALKLKIEEFANNDKSLVDKYNTLREEAKEKIATLEEELQNNKELSNSQQQELNTEINRLNNELTKANTAIETLEQKSNEAVEIANSYVMTKAESLPGLDEEDEKTTATVHFYSDSINTTITLSEDINLDFWNSKGNIKIDYLSNVNEDNTVNLSDIVSQKDKSWSGYLNNNGNKYGQGHGIGGSETDKTYSNQLLAKTTYSTTLNMSIGETKFNKINAVRITVTSDNGDTLYKEIFKK